MNQKLKSRFSLILTLALCFSLFAINVNAATYDYTTTDYLDAYNTYVSGYPTLSIGSTDSHVIYIQRMLGLSGFYSGPENGVFDSATKTAVMNCQRATTSPAWGDTPTFAPITADGICGKYTWGKLIYTWPRD